MTLINGWNGPYSNYNAINRGANAGRKVAALTRSANAGNIASLYTLLNSDIQYTTKENGKFSIDGGLAYSKESLKALDTNKDGIVSSNEAGALGSVIDLNNDGIISASENLAYTMYQDASGKMDGIVTAQERAKADAALMADPYKAKAQMKKLHEGHNLAQREQQLDNKMSMQNQNNVILQFMMQAFMTLLQLFRGDEMNNLFAKH